MQPIMGKTIAAVFLCLSAVSVKGFLFMRRLSALLLQLSKSASDALPFGRFLRYVLFLDLSLPLGKAAVILFYNGFGFSVSRHKRLHIGVTLTWELSPASYGLLSLRPAPVSSDFALCETLS